MFQGLASSAFQRLLPKKWCKMLLLVWFSIADYSLLLSVEKPQVPATVRGIKRKLPGALFCKALAINKFWLMLNPFLKPDKRTQLYPSSIKSAVTILKYQHRVWYTARHRVCFCLFFLPDNRKADQGHF